jgi:hypothetical protein
MKNIFKHQLPQKFCTVYFDTLSAIHNFTHIHTNRNKGLLETDGTSLVIKIFSYILFCIIKVFESTGNPLL